MLESTRPVRRSTRNVAQSSSNSTTQSKRKSTSDTSESRPAKKSKSSTKSVNKNTTASKSAKSTSKTATPKGQHDTISPPDTTKNYWLLKAEPESRIEKGKDVKFSIDDLSACTVPEPWSGVRNHVAKNNMLAMKKGDLAFFYHSSCKVPGVVGIMEVVREATPDLSAFDSKDPYYDPKSDETKPRWFNVHVEFREKFEFPEKATLTELKGYAENNGPLSGMALVKQSRLSVSRVSSAEWEFIVGLAKDGGT